MRRLLNSAAFYTVAFLLIFELAARLVTSDAGLIRMRVPCVQSAMEMRRRLARSDEARHARLLVVGDSTADQDLDACTLGGVNLGLAAGALEHASLLIGAAAHDHAPQVVYMASHFRTTPWTEELPLTFSDRVHRDGLAPAIAGEITVLYGRRKLIGQVADALRQPRARHAWDEEIVGRGGCGLALSRAPSGDREAQLALYSAGIPARFADLDSHQAELIASLSSLRGRSCGVAVILPPMRPDMRAHVERNWPGGLARARESWRRVAGETQFIDCTECIDDDALFYDPLHLNRDGRQRFTQLLGQRLARCGGS